jgi:hypothetical protein
MYEQTNGFPASPRFAEASAGVDYEPGYNELASARDIAWSYAPLGEIMGDGSEFAVDYPVLQGPTVYTIPECAPSVAGHVPFAPRFGQALRRGSDMLHNVSGAKRPAHPGSIWDVESPHAAGQMTSTSPFPGKATRWPQQDPNEDWSVFGEAPFYPDAFDLGSY